MPKKLLSLILALTLALSLVVPAFAVTPEDAQEDAMLLYNLGLFKGTGTTADGSPKFDLDRAPTRAEAVTLVNRTLDRHPDKSHFTKDMLVWPDNMDQTKWYYADMQEATNSHTYQMKENSDKTKYENWTKTLPIRNWEALEKAWSNANSSQGNGNVV